MGKVKIMIYALVFITFLIEVMYISTRQSAQGLNTERSILLQVIAKEKVIEKKLFEQNAKLNIRLAALTQKDIVAKEKIADRIEIRKTDRQITGNRGFLFRKTNTSCQQSLE